MFSPQNASLACGDVGVGAMAEVDTLVAAVRALVATLELPAVGEEADDGARAAMELDAAS
jgi:phosphopantothenoylcysteine synthetase/decarboxylase